MEFRWSWALIPYFLLFHFFAGEFFLSELFLACLGQSTLNMKGSQEASGSWGWTLEWNRVQGGHWPTFKPTLIGPKELGVDLVTQWLYRIMMALRPKPHVLCGGQGQVKLSGSFSFSPWCLLFKLKFSTLKMVNVNVHMITQSLGLKESIFVW